MMSYCSCASVFFLFWSVNTRLLEDNYGPDNLKLAVIKAYVANLLNNARVVRWLARSHADYLQQLQSVAEIKSLPDALK